MRSKTKWSFRKRRAEAGFFIMPAVKSETCARLTAERIFAGRLVPYSDKVWTGIIPEGMELLLEDGGKTLYIRGLHSGLVVTPRADNAIRVRLSN